jgi:hypothetical protein
MDFIMGEKIHTGILWKNMKERERERENLEDLGIDGRIILK